jgi:hypothetical protein
MGIRVQLSPPSDQRLPRARKRGRMSMEEYQNELISNAVAVKGCCQKGSMPKAGCLGIGWYSITSRLL